MNRDDSLEALFAELRRPASASEIAGEAEAVDAIASAVMMARATPMRLLSNRRLRVASIVAAGVIGFGGVAAAGPAVFDTVTGGNGPTLGEPVVEPEDAVVVSTSTKEPTVTETTVTSIVADPAGTELEPSTQDETDPGGETETEAPESATTLVDDPDTTFDETACAEGSHGKTVSSVAQETPSGPGKGKVVSEAAHSSCGKQTPPDDETDDDETDDDETDDDETGSGNGNGGNGNGGNGNGGNANGGNGNGGNENGGNENGGNGNGGGGSGNGNGNGNGGNGGNGNGGGGNGKGGKP